MYQRVYPADLCMQHSHHLCFSFGLDTPVQHQWIHTHHKTFITTTCKTSVYSVPSPERAVCTFPHTSLYSKLLETPLFLCAVSLTPQPMP